MKRRSRQQQVLNLDAKPACVTQAAQQVGSELLPTALGDLQRHGHRLPPQLLAVEEYLLSFE